VKLLFDENLSYRLVRALQNTYPDSAHVRDLGLEGAADRLIWTVAAQGGYLLTSKDTDFYQRSLVYGAPPKVIWLRVGNGSTAAVAALLRERYVVVRRCAGCEMGSVLARGAANLTRDLGRSTAPVAVSPDEASEQAHILDRSRRRTCPWGCPPAEAPLATSGGLPPPPALRPAPLLTPWRVPSVPLPCGGARCAAARTPRP
jgi:predicted nuclease of predicted toxin-antitoxin system